MEVNVKKLILIIALGFCISTYAKSDDNTIDEANLIGILSERPYKCVLKEEFHLAAISGGARVVDIANDRSSTPGEIQVVYKLPSNGNLILSFNCAH